MPNNNIINFCNKKTIVEIFQEQVEKNPEQVAIYFEEKTISYVQLNEQANKLARFLRNQGVKDNVIVGLDVKRSHEMIVAIFAILKAGGAYLPIDSSNPFARKCQILKDSKIEFLLFDNPDYSEELYSDYTFLDFENEEIKSQKSTNLTSINSSNDLAYVIYTSGSTGTPKGVMVEHLALLNRIEWMQEKFPIASNDVIFQKTPSSFDVSVWEILWWSIAGASVLLLPPGKEHDVRMHAKLIMKANVSVMHYVPSVLRIFLSYIESDFDLNKLKSLKYVFSSGEELDADMVRRFNNLFNENKLPLLINLYGPTEATIDVSYFICNKDHDYKSIPIGKPINNTELYVLDDTYNKLGIDAAGELYIGGIGLSRGYLNNHELTSKAFISNPFNLGTRIYKTGDIAKWNNDGELLFLGRKDEQVKLRGLRVDLNEIKYHLLQHEAIDDAVIMYITNASFDQKIIAFIVYREGSPSDSNFEVKNFILERLPHYMVPSAFISVSEFPLKTNGKIDKEKLTAMST
jgi:D-alanine--poly(phosphoribitol) ligase subunit 1